MKLPRRLTSDQQEKIASKIRPFGAVQFDVALHVGPETQTFLFQLEMALKAGGWTQVDWSAGNSNVVFTRSGLPKAGVWTGTGVAVELHKEKQDVLYPPVQALVDALVSEGIEAIPMLIGPDTNDNPSAIHVMIGEKPK
jgi:hypothetical protein